MSTGTQALSGADVLAGAGRKADGFFKRVFNRISQSQERKAETMVRQYLASMSDAQLVGLGYTPVEIKTIRKSGAGGPGAAWL